MAGKPYTIRKSAKHGHWIKKMTYPMGYVCSECNHLESVKSPYCRWCGKKMDGGK